MMKERLHLHHKKFGEPSLVWSYTDKVFVLNPDVNDVKVKNQLTLKAPEEDQLPVYRRVLREKKELGRSPEKLNLSTKTSGGGARASDADDNERENKQEISKNDIITNPVEKRTISVAGKPEKMNESFDSVESRGKPGSFQCFDCGVVLSTKNSLNVHMRLHTGATPYQCKECGRKFRYRATARNHLRLEHKIILTREFHKSINTIFPTRPSQSQKPFKCLVCGGSFARKGSVYVHMRLHTGEKPFCCKCGEQFRFRSNAITHLRIAHNVFPCDFQKWIFRVKACKVKLERCDHLLRHPPKRLPPPTSEMVRNATLKNSTNLQLESDSKSTITKNPTHTRNQKDCDDSSEVKTFNQHLDIRSESLPDLKPNKADLQILTQNSTSDFNSIKIDKSDPDRISETKIQVLDLDLDPDEVPSQWLDDSDIYDIKELFQVLAENNYKYCDQISAEESVLTNLVSEAMESMECDSDPSIANVKAFINNDNADQTGTQELESLVPPAVKYMEVDEPAVAEPTSEFSLDGIKQEVDPEPYPSPPFSIPPPTTPMLCLVKQEQLSPVPATSSELMCYSPPPPDSTFKKPTSTLTSSLDAVDFEFVAPFVHADLTQPLIEIEGEQQQGYIDVQFDTAELSLLQEWLEEIYSRGFAALAFHDHNYCIPPSRVEEIKTENIYSQLEESSSLKNDLDENYFQDIKTEDCDEIESWDESLFDEWMEEVSKLSNGESALVEYAYKTGVIPDEVTIDSVLGPEGKNIALDKSTLDMLIAGVTKPVVAEVKPNRRKQKLKKEKKFPRLEVDKEQDNQRQAHFHSNPTYSIVTEAVKMMNNGGKLVEEVDLTKDDQEDYELHHEPDALPILPTPSPSTAPPAKKKAVKRKIKVVMPPFGRDEDGNKNEVDVTSLVPVEPEESSCPSEAEPVKAKRKKKKTKGVLELEKEQEVNSTVKAKNGKVIFTDRPFKCSECQQSFLHKAYLEVHMRTHTGVKPYRCKNCLQDFRYNTNLYSHLKRDHGIHNNFWEHTIRTDGRSKVSRKPGQFQCPQCENSFTSRSSLTSHFRRHTGEKPYLCTVCLERFSNTTSCYRHASAIHNHHSGFGSIIFNIKECAVRLERCDTKKTKKNISDLPPEIIIINES